ncbi:glycosyltransferase involved in cell wall biosynthesis [Wenyingzhuangia heitensis]|uniref:Glycosyltransferase involved in cell wall biosynthesis n=1 Tax=Wenyingzhuangia heitensis TaxID=1487859 RepID=A0ABX0U637_9FLAO|nr:glycosyltransferase [Wenyingzhuangia heitensis]NIJ44309.1 glycosyltransferase involved in cell wall biosynthesis [Wenyingzhuangia heitensis]
MQEKELVSIIMAIYKEPVAFVKQAIDSVLQQTYKNIEVIIINDNPNDVVLDKLVHSYTDIRIEYTRNSKNIGLAKSLNKAIELSKGDYIARMDADDISFLDRLEKQITFLNNNPIIDVVGSPALLIDEQGIEKGLFKVPTTTEQVKISALFGVPFVHPTVMFTKRVFKEFKFLYNPDFTTAQDFELWSRLVHQLNGANLVEPLLYYRESDQQLSKNRVVEQTVFFTKALTSQLTKLGVVLTDKELTLLGRMSRNKKQETFSLSEVLELRRVLQNIYNTIPNYSNYNKKLLRKQLFVNLSLTIFYFKGNRLLFHREIKRFMMFLNVSFIEKILFTGFMVKIFLLTIKK